MTAEEFAAVEQARALLARPAQVSVLRARPYPRGMRMLLRVAANDEAALQLAAERTGDSRAALHEACVFYVQQVLLDEASDSYRILGVDSNAATAEIKAHYGLLMRWMHPDRNPDAWEVVFAERVNRAWNDLRTADRRAAYDRPSAPQPEPEPGAEDWAGQAAPFRPRPAQAAHLRPDAVVPSGDTSGMKIASRRWLGAVAVAGIAAMALFVAWPPEPDHGPGSAPGSSSDAIAESPQGSAPASRAPASPDASADSTGSGDPKSTPGQRQIARTPTLATPSDPVPIAVLAPPVSQALQPSIPDPSAQQATVVDRNTRREATDPDRVAASRQATGSNPSSRTTPDIVAPVASSAPPPPSVASAAPEPVQPTAPSIAAIEPRSTAQPANFPEAPAQPAKAPDLDQASLLIGRFAHAYQKGDTAALTALFTADATSQGGGIEQIREAYDRQFARTSQRSISIRDIKWRVQDERALATGRFEILQAAPGKLEQNSVSRGTIRFDIEQHQDRVLISRLEHIERGL